MPTPARTGLHFDNLEAILADAERVALKPGVKTTGNWTPGQIVEHVTLVIDTCMEGFPSSGSWLLRAILRLMKGSVLRKPMRSGFKIPKGFEVMSPPAGTDAKQAVDHLRRSIAKFRTCDRFYPSPILGTMTSEEWEMLHCRHAEMHFGFMG
ncbi:MAG: DUF1569 domain-containing protein [Phycisphaerales bacterium]|nr:DUF1569 domain-containing protein [Phycisphaerales bacterium]